MKINIPGSTRILNVGLAVSLWFICMTINGQRTWTLNEKEYFNSGDFSVLFFHNIYPVGKQGGIEFIDHDRRIATNGNIHYILKEPEQGEKEKFQAEPIPRIDNPARICDFQHKTATVNYTSKWISYKIVIQPEGDGFRMDCVLPSKLGVDQLASLFFEIELYPEVFKGKSYYSGKQSGIFPWLFSGESEERNGEELPVPLATGKMISLAPEEPSLGLQITSDNATMELYDGRGESERSWFVLRAYADLAVPTEGFSLHFLPATINGWQKPPMIAYSQIGYHPLQPKKAIFELDQNAVIDREAELERILPDGSMQKVFSIRPRLWGKFLRYPYAIFDFSSIIEPGIYLIRYGNYSTNPFPIAADIFDRGIWQPSLEVFMPVQMCHMRVTDRGRVWHGVCHLDDALQAPAPLPWFDGFDQANTTETPFAPNTLLPGMNEGGWHDAGDDDINTGSAGKTVYQLALAVEEFGLPWDQTTVDFPSRRVILHQPDSIPDAMEQIIHGLHWILPQYRIIGHSIVGVVSSNWEEYLQTADWGLFTDNLFYQPGWPADSSNGRYSGKFDDRYAFTNKDSRREYFVASTLAAASRVVTKYDPSLATECLQVARRIWKTEEGSEPVLNPSVGTPYDLVRERINAAVELYLSTKDDQYLDKIIESKKSILNDFKKTAWSISRIIDYINNKSFRKDYEDQLSNYSTSLRKELSTNPFGVHYGSQVWGIGWNILWDMVEHYYLIKKYPDLFPEADLFNALSFIVGIHPGSCYSFVSGVGTHPPIPAFGINRSDYAYIPGGVYSGTAMVQPDFPELKTDHPFLWQQSEYIISGAAPYIFCVLAAEKLLNK
jgi:endoglucanase